MKHRVFKDPETGELIKFYRKNYTHDLLDTKRFKWHPQFKDLKTLLGCKHEVQAQRLAIKVVNEFFEMLAEDMIEKRVYFVMPRIDSFSLLIKETTNPDRDDYIYLLETGGRYYKPVLHWANPQKRFKVNVRFTRRWRKKLFEKNTINQ